MFSSNTSQVSGGYEIQRSLRFNSADSAYLNRALGSPTSASTWTLSLWFKRSSITSSEYQYLWSYDSGGAAGIAITSSSDANPDVLYLYNGSTINYSTGLRRLRDPSAWYHVVVSCSAGSATVYLNGSSTATISSVSMPNMSLGIASNIGRYTSFGGVNYFSGYMTEVNFIDGQALTPSSFGAFDAQTGVWGPTRYAGSYGTNGFYLNFSDNSNTTAATLGRDYSPNGNNWTPNNFSVSAGAGNDSLVDVPTNWGTDTGVGGTVRGNYATLNPLNATPSALISNGNLYALSNLSGHYTSAPATISVTSGKWYAEVVFTRVAGSTDAYYVGVADAAWQASQLDGGGWYGRWWRDGTGYAYGENGNKITGTTSSAYGATYTQGDVMGIALDMDAGTLTFYKNGISQGVAFTGITGTKTMAAGAYKDASITLALDINLGQRPFAYTAPSGFKALNTQNLPTPTIGATTATQAGKFFNPVLYTGTGAAPRTISGVGFQPDLVWTKSRSNLSDPAFVDSVRGGTKLLLSNSTSSEFTGTWINSFNSDGYVLENTGSAFNLSGYTYVAWNWKANGAGVTNTAGSITSTVSANTTSGFSVVTWTTDGTTKTVGHGLGVAPKMIIVKQRNAASPWYVFTTAIDGSYDYLVLNTTAPVANSSYTAPTATVFEYNDDNAATQVAYCFAEVPGYSRIGNYVGNENADGPFVYCGFRPRYIILKNTNPVFDVFWVVIDTARNTSNVANNRLYPNNSNAEDPLSSGGIDILSNGFKIRTADLQSNGNTAVTFFAAFAENPFKYSLAR